MQQQTFKLAFVSCSSKPLQVRFSNRANLWSGRAQHVTTRHVTFRSRSCVVTARLFRLRPEVAAKVVPVLANGRQAAFYIGDKGAILDRCMRGILSLLVVVLFGGILGRTLRVLAGFLSVSFPLVAPYFLACRRNAELRSNPHAGLLCGALRSERWQKDPSLLRIVVASPEGRVEEFVPYDHELAEKLAGPVDAHALVFSKSPGFERLSGLAEIYLPGLNMFVSRTRYPFASKSKFREVSIHADMDVRTNP